MTQWAMKHWRPIVIVAAVLSAVGIFVFGFGKLDELAGLVPGLSGFSMNSISSWCPFSGVSYAGLWTTEAPPGADIAVHIVLDAFLMLTYGAGFLAVTSCMKSNLPRFVTFLRWLLLAGLVMDVTEDTLFATVAANVGSDHAWVLSVLPVVTTLKWLAILPLAALVGGGIIFIGIRKGFRWLKGRRPKTA